MQETMWNTSRGDQVYIHNNKTALYVCNNTELHGETILSHLLSYHASLDMMVTRDNDERNTILW